MGGPLTRYVRGIYVDPDTADMLEAIFEVLDAEGIRLEGIPGFGSYRDNTASGATDNGGGHADLSLVPFTNAQRRRAETVARMMGGAAFWRPARRPDGTRYGWQEHLHILRMDARDLSANARTQVQDYLLGWNGLPIGGRTTRDTGTRDYTSHRWLTVKKELDMFTDEDRLNILRIKSAVEGFRSEEAGRYSSNFGKLNDILAATDLDPDEVAAIKASVDQSARLDDLTAKVDTLAAAVANLVTLVQEIHAPKAEPAKVPATQYGVDVSGWQTVERVDGVTADPKYGFVIVKASQGMSSGNAAHDSQVAEVREAGLCVGHYHFAECDQDPIRELDNFLARAKVQSGDVVALDAEDWDQKDHPERMANTPWTQRLAFVLTWLEEAERRLGVRPLVYVNWNWIKGLRTAATQEQWDRLTRYDVWLAQWFLGGVPVEPGEYDHIDDKDGTPEGWPVVMHQWTNNDGGLDGNYMPDPAAWAKYAVP